MDIRESLFERFVRTYSKSDVLFQQNTRGREMYVIYSGKVKLLLQGEGQKETELATLGPGDFFGEMALIDWTGLRTTTAVIDEDDTQLIILDRAKFMYLSCHQPTFALLIMQKLCRRLKEANLALQQAQEEIRCSTRKSDDG